MSDAQFALDVAAKMDGSSTLAQLDQLTAKLMSGGKNSEAFQAAMAQVSKDLVGASAAAKAANESLAQEETLFRQLEKASLKASVALEKAGQKASGSVPADLAINARAATAALSAQTEKMRALEAAAKGATEKEEGLLRTQRNLDVLNGHVNKSLAGNAEAIEKLRFGLGSAGGSAGQLGSKLLAPVQGFAKLSGEMGASRAAAILGAAAFAALAVAAVAVAAAVVIATVKIAAWAIGLADSARAAKLSSYAMIAMHPELAALGGTISEVSRETNRHADELQALAGSLKDAKVAAADMPAALRAAALAETALGKGGSAEFITQIKAGKVAVGQLAAETQSKLGGIVAKQMLGIDAQSARLHDNIGKIFGGLNIDPALTGMQRLVALFDENTVAGEALKFLFESVFQPIINQADKASIMVEAFYLGVLIGATKIYIALKPTIKAISELFGFNDPASSTALQTLTKAGELLAPVFLGLTVVVGAFVALVAGAFAVVLAIPIASMAIWVGAFMAGKAAVMFLVDGVTAAIGWIQGIDFGAVGMNIITGIANGITGAAGFLLDAIGGAVKGAISHAKSLLGISSPSKVFAGIGDQTVAGFTGSVEDGTGAAADAVAGLVSPSPALAEAQLSGDAGAVAALSSPSDSPRASAAPASSSGGPGASGMFAGAVLNFYGDNAQSMADQVIEIITKTFEGDAAQLGASVA